VSEISEEVKRFKQIIDDLTVGGEDCLYLSHVDRQSARCISVGASSESTILLGFEVVSSGEKLYLDLPWDSLQFMCNSILAQSVRLKSPVIEFCRD